MSNLEHQNCGDDNGQSDNTEIIDVKSTEVTENDSRHGVNNCVGLTDLPTTQRTKTDSDEFRQMIIDQAPEDISAEISGILKNSRQTLKIWELLLAIIGIGTIISVFIYLIPDGKIKPDVISIAGLEQETNTRLYRAFEDVENEYDQKNYHEFVKRMDPYVESFFQNNTSIDDIRNDSVVLYKYFDACQLTKPDPRRDATRRKQLKKLTASDPDTYQWTSFYLMAEYSCLSNEIKEFKITTVNDKCFIQKNSSGDLISIDDLLEKLRTENDKLKKMIIQHKDKDNASIALRVMRCKILINIWLLNTQTNDWDNFYGAPGVEEREEAYSELKEITDYGRDYGDYECLKLQKFVVKELLNHCNLLWLKHPKGGIRFNGNDYWRQEHLRTALEEIENNLNRNAK